MNKILFIILGHLTGDYLFQSNYLAMNKGTSKYILFVHSMLYSLGILIVARFMNINISNNQLIIIALIHYLVDYMKATGISIKFLGEKRALMIDQAIHYLTLIFVL